MPQRGRSGQPVKARRANKPKVRKVSTAAPSVADLQKQVGALTRELEEAREQQTATAEMLQVINSSPGNLAPVFAAILEKATRLCGAKFGILWLYDGERFTLAATHAVPAALVAFVRKPPPAAAWASLVDIVRGQNLVHFPDLAATELYHAGNPGRRAYVDLGGARTLISVALRKDNALLGAFNVFRQEVRPFNDQQIELVNNFAKQAVIAIEITRLSNETKEALERQTTTADILKVIASSPSDLQPVFDAIVNSAARLFESCTATITTLKDSKLHWNALATLRSDFDTSGARAIYPIPPDPDRAPSARAILERRIIEIPDTQAPDTPEFTRQASAAGGFRSVIFVPLVHRDTGIGTIILSHPQPGFKLSEKQLALVQTFADQAVIAIENARLFNETKEALEQQTATAEVLRVISSSPGNLQPVFAVMLENAVHICEANFGNIYRWDGNALHLVAGHNTPTAFNEARGQLPYHPNPQTAAGRMMATKATVQIADLAAEQTYLEQHDPQIVAAVELGGVRTVLAVPMLKEGELVGAIILARKEVRAFSDKQIALVSNFAAQAVIATENTRLLSELRESLQQQTATADVLKVVSRSSVDLEKVLDTLVETVMRLCRADQAYMLRSRDDKYRNVASRGLSQDAKEFFFAHSMSFDRGTLGGRVALERRVVHIPDVFQDSEYTYWEGQKLAGHRTMLGIPLLREDTLVGIFVVTRTRVEPFTDKEIELASTFADQAVIAIENARLFEELRDRQAELRVTFDNMGDGVVMFDVKAQLTAWNRNFQEMLDLPDAFLSGRPSFDEYFRYLAGRGEYSTDLEAQLSRTIEDTSREMRFERTRPDGRVMEVRRNPVPGGGFVLIYADITERKRAEEAIRIARDAAETALRELQIAQASLVHAQKMAALGQVTAGIAHEIKNPLNFVNNFAGLSVELLDELKNAAARAVGALDPGERAEIVETIGMLTGNLEKIVEHSRRADGIVRSMLQHSRGGSDDWQPTDLNALVEEALNLGYHGARSQDQNFDIALERDLDRDLAPIDLVPQEMTRVLLNLIGNGFYAAHKRSGAGDGTYRPTLKVTTREFGDSVEIRVRDNGIGIPPENREKLFQPFFTTKPTGEGTGLGLSISYEIVTQQHSGTVTVDSEVGDFTEFTVRLPRRSRAVTGNT
jgi:PAS domain S-box-containing protein